MDISSESVLSKRVSGISSILESPFAVSVVISEGEATSSCFLLLVMICP